MDIGKDIAYHIRRVWEKETAIFATRSRKALGTNQRSLTCSNPMYALILAGGSGERFWPLSRRARPNNFFASSRTKLCSKKL